MPLQVLLFRHADNIFFGIWEKVMQNVFKTALIFFLIIMQFALEAKVQLPNVKSKLYIPFPISLENSASVKEKKSTYQELKKALKQNTPLNQNFILLFDELAVCNDIECVFNQGSLKNADQIFSLELFSQAGLTTHFYKLLSVPSKTIIRRSSYSKRDIAKIKLSNLNDHIYKNLLPHLYKGTLVIKTQDFKGKAIEIYLDHNPLTIQRQGQKDFTQSLKLKAGPHIVQVSTPGKPTTFKIVTLPLNGKSEISISGNLEKTLIELDKQSIKTQVPILSKKKNFTPKPKNKKLKNLLIGSSTIFVGSGIGFGVGVHRLNSDNEKIKSDTALTSSQKNIALNNNHNKGRLYETLQWVGYGLGAALLVTGLSIPTKSKQVDVIPSPNGVGVQFKF